MAIFDPKTIEKLKKLNFKKIFTLSLHIGMLILCIIGSIVFLSQVLSNQTGQQQVNFGQAYSFSSFKSWVKLSFEFIKIKFLIPIFILSYLFYCIRNNTLHKILKDDYITKYEQKYKKINKLAQRSNPNQISQPETLSQSSQSSRDKFNNNQQNLNNLSFESSLNLSMQMVKSMSRSMMGSMRSIGSQNLTGSLVSNGNIGNRSSKIIQNLSKKNIIQSSGKDISNLFQKGKNISQSFLSASSSGLQADEVKIRIKNRRYFEVIDEQQSKIYKKWYDEANKKYIETLKSQKLDKLNHKNLAHLKKGLKDQLQNFIRQYHQNTQTLKQFLTKCYCIKIQGFQNQKTNRNLNDIQNRLNSDRSKNSSDFWNKRTLQKEKIMYEKQIFRTSSSAAQFISNLNYKKIGLRNPSQKQYVQKQLIHILNKRVFLNRLMNISTIESQIFSGKQNKKLKMIQEGLKLLNNNKMDIFSFLRTQNQFTQLDLLQEQEIQRIKQLVEIRVIILVFIVNKINLIASQKNFKIKMKEAITNDSGFLSQTINFFNNKNFAQILCTKGYDKLIPHYNIKIYKDMNNQETKKQNIIYCKPGLDNAFSVINLLSKKILECLNQKSYADHSNYQDNKNQQKLRKFVETLYPDLQF